MNTHYFASFSDTIEIGQTQAPRIPGKPLWERGKTYSPREMVILFQRVYDLGKSDALHNLSTLMESMKPAQRA